LISVNSKVKLTNQAPSGVQWAIHVPLALAQALQTWKDSSFQFATLNAVVIAQWATSELLTPVNVAVCASHSLALTRTIKNDKSVIVGPLPKTNASNALVNKESEIFTLNASLPEKSCLNLVQKSSFTGLKMDALKNAENQPQLLADALFRLILSDEFLLKSRVLCAKLNEILRLICVPVNAFLPLSIKTVKWRNSAVAALLPRLLRERLLSTVLMVPPGLTLSS